MLSSDVPLAFRKAATGADNTYSLTCSHFGLLFHLKGLLQRGETLPEARLKSLEDRDAVKDKPLTPEDIQNASLHTFSLNDLCTRYGPPQDVDIHILHFLVLLQVLEF